MQYLFMLVFLFLLLKIIYDLLTQLFNEILAYINSLPQIIPTSIAGIIFCISAYFLIKSLYQYYLSISSQYKYSYAKVKEHNDLLSQVKSITRK